MVLVLTVPAERGPCGGNQEIKALLKIVDWERKEGQSKSLEDSSLLEGVREGRMDLGQLCCIFVALSR